MIKLDFFTFISFYIVLTCIFKGYAPIVFVPLKHHFVSSKLVPNFSLCLEGATNITRGPICHTLLLVEV
jgi:hypothetical protein